MIKTKSFDLESEDESYSEYEYDDAGNKIKAFIFNKSGNLIERNTYTYDDKNKMINLLEEGVGKYSNYAFEYDEDGNAVKQVETDEEGDEVSAITNIYEDGNIIEVQSFGREYHHNMMYKYEYEFYE